jgi:hypothetical protein
VLAAPLVPGVVEADAAHGLDRGGEAAAVVVPRRRGTPLLPLDQPQEGFVNQGRRLERRVGRLLRQPLSR